MPNATSGAAGSSSRPLNDPGLVRLLAEALQSQDSFARDAGNLLYTYCQGVFKAEAEQFIKREVKRLLIDWDQSRRWSQHLVAEVTAYIGADAPLLWSSPPSNRLNLANGLLDLQSHVLYPHTPAHRSVVQLPLQFDPTADCPTWDQFLATVLPRDVFGSGLIWAMIAQTMTATAGITAQALILSGNGGNGKSTLLTGLRSLLGATNVASLGLEQITNEQFAAAHLFGKLANICDDLASGHLRETSTFKRITSGDPLVADRKFKEPLFFSPFARLIFSTNDLPNCLDQSEGYYQRWLVLPFPHEFRGQHGEIPRHILDAQLAAPQELSGVLNRALATIPSVLGRRLQMTESMRAAWTEFRNSTDWVLIWLERMLIEDSTGVIEKKAIHQALILEAQRQRRAVISPTALYRQIRRHWPQALETQRRIDPARDGVPCFVGLSWRHGVPPV